MKAKTNSKFFEKNITRFVFCSFFPVGLEDYVNFFKEKFDDFIYIKFKFPHSRDSKAYSAIQTYLYGKLKNESRLFSFSLVNQKLLYFIFLPLNYLIYFLEAIFSLNFYFSSKKKGKVVFMGINYFCAFCGIILKRLGKVDFVIYRVMDFFPLPVSGPYRLLNRIFYILDEFCLKNVDSIWFTTEGHIIGREKYGYFKRKDYIYQIIPLGVNYDQFISKPVSKKNVHSLVYCGIISRYQMLDLLFEALQELKKEIKDIKLNLIGSGPDEKYFREMSVKMKLTDNIIFHGYLEENDEFRSIIADNILGIALYKNEENYMRYTEPAKVKYYLNYGVPALVSDVPMIAKELNEKKVCFAVRNDKDEIVRIIKIFMTSDNMQKEYKENIKRYIKTIDINNLLDSCFKSTFNIKIN